MLTLTSGGCNALNLLLHGAGNVVSVDCNPAQSALLELKATGIRCVTRNLSCRPDLFPFKELKAFLVPTIKNFCLSLPSLQTGGRRHLQFNDFWKMFGEGKHLGIDKIYEAKLAPFMTQTSLRFWSSRLWYFRQGLYYQGGMVCPSPHSAILENH